MAFEPFLKEKSLLVQDLWGSSKAYLACQIAKRVNKHLLVISAHEDDGLFEDFRFFGKEAVLDFPAWETLPGEEISPSLDIVGKRLDVLFRLQQEKTPKILLTSLQALLQKVAPPSLLKETSSVWKVNDTVPFETLPSFLEKIGYHRVPVVSDKGEYALRCGILDLFPLSSLDPYRIEFFGDTLSEIRTFDPISQKSTGKVSSVFVSPGSETSLLEHPVSLFEYLQDPYIIFNEVLDLEDKAVQLKNMPGSKSPLFLDPLTLLKEGLKHPHLFFSTHRIETLSEIHSAKGGLSLELFGSSLKTKLYRHSFETIQDFFSEEILKGVKEHKEINDIIFLCASESEKNTLDAALKHYDLVLPPTAFQQGNLSSGFVLKEEKKAFIPMTEFHHRQIPRRQKWRTTHHALASEFHELEVGNLVVHFHHGIGKYLGIEKKQNHTKELSEFLVIAYEGESKLYVPVTQSYLVSRYIGSHEETPRLSTLGSNRWQTLRQNTQQAIVGYASDLIKYDAERSVYQKKPCPPDSETMQLFERDFPFAETEDQLLAIKAIKEDLQSDKPMDRLICGDVGYGKTEVAMRAAFKIVADQGGQVAVLVPTTVLALQHFETFKARMANFPVKVALISRFSKPKEVKKTLEELAKGTIDIVVGTHRLISDDVKFDRLSLLIIDEEQRFGVRAKEHLKKRKIGVDCLTLSATPIPRTLYLSLIGIRNVSVIHTPPQDRLPIKSILAEKDQTLIQNALTRELSRKGQAFYVHNRVDSIFLVASELQKIVPDAKIIVGHGQMGAEELDAVFHAFKSGTADILVATTIIENGIDIPNANTILIDRADTFGLSDLYQMRGRVGRWNKPAYAYFLIPQNKSLPELTEKRLSAIISSSGYGAGMKIALRDLEIRGAGDILGVQQSGHVSAIGFHLYCKLLTRAISALKNKETLKFTEIKMEFSFNASLPETYINATSLRMEIYHRLGDAMSFKELEELFAELKDRFGPPPLEVRFLYHMTRLKLFAAQESFIFLKLEKYTLTAEKQYGKKTEKKILPLPQTKKPDLLEKEIIELLKNNF